MNRPSVDSQTTEANYDRWHRALEVGTQEGHAPRRAVLISEILGDTDGPFEEEWE